MLTTSIPEVGLSQTDLLVTVAHLFAGLIAHICFVELC